MVNAEKHRNLTADIETRMKKQKDKFLLRSNNARKQHHNLSKILKNYHGRFDKSLDNIAIKQAKIINGSGDD